MIIHKITPGYVIQVFDTEAKEFTFQEFVAGNEVEYEDETGDVVDFDVATLMMDYYLPYEMVQPEDM